MKKKLFWIIVYSFLVGGMVFGSGISSLADKDDSDDRTVSELQQSINDKESKINNLESQKAELAAGRSDIQKVVNNLRSQKNEMSAYVTQLDAEVTELQNSIDDLNSQCETKELEIAEAEKELAEAEQVADEQYEAMKKRIQFMYERGDSFVIEMLVSADSFGDMLNKAEYIENLSAYDRRMLDEYRLVIKNVELSKEVLEEEKEVLEETKQAVEAKQDDLNVLIDEKEQQITAFNSDIATNEAAIAEYDAEIAEQNSIIKALEAQVAAEKQAMEEANKKTYYTGGAFTWPAPSYTRISSEFGWRVHPTLGVNKFHNGLDMAAPGGSPILAACDGKVVAAGYSSSMGNYIMIDHGDGLMTIYMHASALYVSKGAEVTRGQKIAAVGTTGRSTGNHLHFGVRLNGEYVSPWNYL